MFQGHARPCCYCICYHQSALRPLPACWPGARKGQAVPNICHCCCTLSPQLVAAAPCSLGCHQPPASSQPESSQTSAFESSSAQHQQHQHLQGAASSSSSSIASTTVMCQHGGSELLQCQLGRQTVKGKADKGWGNLGEVDKTMTRASVIDQPQHQQQETGV